MFTKIPWGKFYYYYCFPDEKTEDNQTILFKVTAPTLRAMILAQAAGRKLPPS